MNRISHQRNLFITLALIPIVYVIAFPPYTDGRSSSRTTALISNLHECGRAVLLYAVDYDDHLPNAYRWMSDTLPLSKSTYVYSDPKNEDAKLPSDPKVPETGRYGIACFAPLSEQDQGKIDDPSDMIMLFTSVHLGWNAAARFNAVNPSVLNGQRFAAAFADGLAKTVPMGALPSYDPKTGAKK